MDLAEVAGCYRIWAFCDVCDRAKALDDAELARRYGAQLTVATIRCHLRCSQCGARAGSLNRVGQPATSIRLVWVGKMGFG